MLLTKREFTLTSSPPFSLWLHQIAPFSHKLCISVGSRAVYSRHTRSLPIGWCSCWCLTSFTGVIRLVEALVDMRSNWLMVHLETHRLRAVHKRAIFEPACQSALNFWAVWFTPPRTSWLSPRSESKSHSLPTNRPSIDSDPLRSSSRERALLI